ncbi:MAG: methylmalonyl Co-A mutase-associated GTPase MeaB, partial [Candidatus Acidiferrum sp.]
MSLSIESWAAQVRAGDVRAISRAITAIENHQPEAEALLQLLFAQTGRAYLTGVTGAPGTGKSTLVDRLAAHFRKHHDQVGVIAVDPTSPYTG